MTIDGSVDSRAGLLSVAIDSMPELSEVSQLFIFDLDQVYGLLPFLAMD